MGAKEVTIKSGITLNVGSYSTIRVEIGVTSEVSNSKDYQKLSDWVQARVRDEIKKTYKTFKGLSEGGIEDESTENY